jgi:flagellar protein FliJ
MKPFKFKLDAVLKLRDFEKQAAHEAYAQAIKRRREIEDGCQYVSENLKKVQSEISSMRQAVFPAAMQQYFFGALQDLQDQLKKLMLELSKAEKAEEKKLNEFLQAKTKVDMLDKLKSKRFEAHFKEELYKEEKEIGDLVNSRYKPIAIL